MKFRKNVLFLIKLKGIWVPLLIGVLYIIIYSASAAENYFETFAPIRNIEMQYPILFFFSCLPLYFINKINYNYINAQFSNKKSLTHRFQLLLSFSIAFTLSTTVIGLIIFKLYEIPFSDIHFLEIAGYTFIYSLFCSTLFNSLLNIHNSMGFLILIYLLPLTELIATLFDGLYQLHIAKYFPFRLGANDSNLLIIGVLIGVFTILSFRFHKTYYL